MLAGFAVENLLKAFWVARGNKMYAAGKLLKIPHAKNHDLVAISDAVGFATEETERKILVMLSEIMTGVGRYPLAVSPRVTETWGSDDDDLLVKLVRRLQKRLREERRANQPPQTTTGSFAPSRV